MASKQLRVDGIGDVIIYKRKGVRYVRLSIDTTGGVRITMPAWLPYKTALDFLEKKRTWVTNNAKPKQLLIDGQRIGKSHVLRFVQCDARKPSVRNKNNAVTVSLPSNLSEENPEAQAAAERGVHRALQAEAARLLPIRIKDLAQSAGYTYRSVRVRRLKSRWGSCNSTKDITLSSYLIQLPWELIDYVLLHELVHTKVMAHGKPFWDELGQHVTDIKRVRAEMRQYQARIM